MSLTTTTPDTTPQRFAEEFLAHLQLDRAVDLERAGRRDVYAALAHTVRDRLMSDWLDTVRNRGRLQAKTVVYLSAEYLLGRQLGNALLATGLTEVAREALAGLGLDLDEVCAHGGRARPGQRRPGPAGGVLHRLAGHTGPCRHRLRHPLRVRHLPADLRRRPPGRAAGPVARPRHPWEFPQPASTPCPVDFGGHTERYDDDGASGRAGSRLEGARRPVQLHGPRLPERRGQHPAAVERPRRPTRSTSRSSTPATTSRRSARRPSPRTSRKVLYPEDSTPQGKELRLQQQYFFVACSLRDFIVWPTSRASRLRPQLPERVIFQLNDTHPVIAIPELMRLLVDEQRDGVGRGLGHHPAVLRLHLPHAAARGAGDLVRRACWAAAAAAPGDHLPDQRATSWPRCAQAFPTTSCPGSTACRSSRRTRSARCGWRTWPPWPACRSTASRHCTPSCCADKVLPDFAEIWPDEVHQRDQRRHPAPVHQAGQPAAVAT